MLVQKRTKYAACLLAIVSSSTWAQELTTARFVGSVDGASKACAAAFPSAAAEYSLTMRRMTQCRMDDPEFTRWHAQLRTSPATRDDYNKGFSTGHASLSRNVEERRQQCASLTSLPCQPEDNTNAKPQR